MDLPTKKLYPDAILPTRAHPEDSGLDLYAYLTNHHKPEIVIYQRQRRLISTGIAVKIPSNLKEFGYEAQVRPRSGLADKYGISCHWGTIDNPYVGELKINIFNFGDAPFTITHGMRIAQLVVAPVIYVSVKEVSELPATDRGTSGYGSTGLYAA